HCAETAHPNSSTVIAAAIKRGEQSAHVLSRAAARSNPLRVPRKPLIISGPSSTGETAGKGAFWSSPRRSSPACKPANRPAAANISRATNTNVDILEDPIGNIQHFLGNFHEWL